MVLFAGVFLAVGLGAAAVALVATPGDLGDKVFPGVFGLVFAGIGGVMLRFGLAPIVFDKRARPAPTSQKSRNCAPRSRPTISGSCGTTNASSRGAPEGDKYEHDARKIRAGSRPSTPSSPQWRDGVRSPALNIQSASASRPGAVPRP